MTMTEIVDTQEQATPGGAAPSAGGVTEPGAFSRNAASDALAFPRGAASDALAFLSDIQVEVAVELGRADLSIGEVMRLAPGSVVHINRMLGDPVDLIIRDRLIARGEVVVVDEKFGLRITEIVSRSTTQ
jgi:flagellar motor switch protein FliN